jgi:hypothetical protein
LAFYPPTQKCSQLKIQLTTWLTVLKIKHYNKNSIAMKNSLFVTVSPQFAAIVESKERFFTS